MGAQILLPTDPGVVPETPQPERRVAANYEKFDGLGPLDHPAGQPPVEGSPSRPGQGPTADFYTPGPLTGLVNTVGGMPLPVENPLWKFNGRAEFVYHSFRQRNLGVGQNFQGIAQTVALGEINSSPPQPGDLASILAGWG